MTTKLRGMISWSGQRDQEFHRTYKIKYRVHCDQTDGPANVLGTPGLPAVGQIWALTVNDVIVETDPWAFCGPETSITPVFSGEPITEFDVEFTFSTKPWGRNGAPFGNPTLEPPKISITFNKHTVEAYNDRFGNPIVNSAWERLRGKHVEFDTGMVTVKIKQNLATLDLPTHAAAYQTVNKIALWGMPPRTIKLGGMSITEAYYGNNQIYYERDLEFEANPKGWDRDLLDESTKVLYGQFAPVNPTTTTTSTTTTTGTTVAGATTSSTTSTTTTTKPPLNTADPVQWKLLPVDSLGTMPDENNPTHFIRFVDRFGNPSRVLLNGHGIPAGTVAPSGNRYLCIYGTINTDVSNTNYWMPVPWPLSFSIYDPVLNPVYNYGDLVIDPATGNKYAIIRDNTVGPPSPSALGWQTLYTTQDRGVYDNSLNYNLGDVVQNMSMVGAGWLHLEYYNETDFVAALGIPTSLTPVFPSSTGNIPLS